MKTILGLDISSATIGWSIIEYDYKQILLKEATKSNAYKKILEVFPDAKLISLEENKKKK